MSARPTPLRQAAGGRGRALIGLGMAGLGLAILSGVVPHEEILVGFGLLAFGCVLVATGRLPQHPGVTRGHMAFLGAAVGAMVGAAWAATGNAPGGPMLLLAILGACLLLAAALHGRTLRVGRQTLAVRDATLCAAVAAGVPVLVWMVQAAFKRASGTTPVEAFATTFLVVPVHHVLGWLGLPATVQGQTLTLPGPHGPLAVQIGVACSGVQAMALFLGILALFAATERPPGRRLAAWTAVGLVGVYVSNLLRLIVVVLSGHAWGEDALQEVHANAGWAFFVAWSVLFALWVRRDLRVQARAH